METMLKRVVSTFIASNRIQAKPGERSGDAFFVFRTRLSLLSGTASIFQHIFLNFATTGPQSSNKLDFRARLCHNKGVFMNIFCFNQCNKKQVPIIRLNLLILPNGSQNRSSSQKASNPELDFRFGQNPYRAILARLSLHYSDTSVQWRLGWSVSAVCYECTCSKEASTNNETAREIGSRKKRWPSTARHNGPSLEVLF